MTTSHYSPPNEEFETTPSRQPQKIQNKTNSENGHLVFSIFKKKKQENNGVSDISSLFLGHCQTNRLYCKQAVLYITTKFNLGKTLLANQVKPNEGMHKQLSLFL